MLERLVARNFQCHKKLDIEVAHPITVLTGPTDAGKSTIIRLLHWVACNRPLGESIQRHGSDHVRGSLFVDGYEIVRKRNDEENSYSLDGRKFLSFGTKVPEEIATLLNIDEVSWQFQLDSHFLFSLSPSEAASELNRVVSLDLIDVILSDLASQVRHAKETIKVDETRLASAEARLSALAWVVDADVALRGMEELESNTEEIRRQVGDLEAALQEVDSLTAHVEDESKRVEDMEAIVQVGEEVLQVRDEVSLLEGVLECIGGIQQGIDALVEEITALENDLVDRMGGLCPLCGQEWDCTEQPD